MQCVKVIFHCLFLNSTYFFPLTSHVALTRSGKSRTGQLECAGTHPDLRSAGQVPQTAFANHAGQRVKRRPTPVALAVWRNGEKSYSADSLPWTLQSWSERYGITLQEGANNRSLSLEWLQTTVQQTCSSQVTCSLKERSFFPPHIFSHLFFSGICTNISCFLQLARALSCQVRPLCTNTRSQSFLFLIKMIYLFVWPASAKWQRRQNEVPGPAYRW